MEHVVEMVSSVWTKLSTALEILVPFEYLTRSSPMNQMLYIYYKKLLRLGGACSLSWILLCDYLGWISRNITRPQKRSSPPQKSLLWREISPCLWKPSQVPQLYCWGPWLGFTWQKDEAKDAQWPLVCLCCDGIEVDNLRMTKCLKRLSIMSAEVEVLQYCISLDELINQNNMLK